MVNFSDARKFTLNMENLSTKIHFLHLSSCRLR